MGDIPGAAMSAQAQQLSRPLLRAPQPDMGVALSRMTLWGKFNLWRGEVERVECVQLHSGRNKEQWCLGCGLRELRELR